MGNALADFRPVQCYNAVQLFDSISLNLGIRIMEEGDQTRYRYKCLNQSSVLVMRRLEDQPSSPALLL